METGACMDAWLHMDEHHRVYVTPFSGRKVHLLIAPQKYFYHHNVANVFNKCHQSKDG